MRRPGRGGAACRINVDANPNNDDPGCVPLNVFTTNPLSPASLKYVLANGAEDDKTTEFVASANVSSDVGFLKSPFAENPAAIAWQLGVHYSGCQRSNRKMEIGQAFSRE